jgi:EpsI family protein
MIRLELWAPAALLALGAAATVGLDRQQVLPLRASLQESVPVVAEGYAGYDVEVSKAEQRVAGMTDYLMRYYNVEGTEKKQYDYSVYVGYYATQRQGKTIHSPKNCLPGAGWEALKSTVIPVTAGAETLHVNRYLLKRKNQAALVLYWYQGRGRVEANEYRVKWNLLRDVAMNGRSDEALVRIIVPLTETTDERSAEQLATRVAQSLVPAVEQALPAGG